MFMRISRRALPLVVLLVFIPGCTPGFGIPVGPFPLSIDLGEGTIDPGALGGGKSGFVFVPVPLCGLPTRGEAQASLKEQAGETAGAFVELDEIILTHLELRAVQGDFSGLTLVELYYLPPGDGIFPSLPVLVAVGAGAGPDGETVALTPIGEPNLLSMMDDAEQAPDNECVKVYLRVTGTAPDEPIRWTGTLDADVYGVAKI